jgi:hypothetical protein
VALAQLEVWSYGTALTVRVNDSVAATPSVSVAFAVKVSDVAADPTVPVMAPVEELSVSPVGKLPVDTLHVKGPVPPVTPNV